MSQMFSALGDPVRCQIVLRLTTGEATVTEVTDWFDVSQPAISRHLKILETSGWIERARKGKTRPCRLRATALHSVEAYLSKVRRALASNYDQLDTILTTKNKNRKQKSNE